MTKQWSIQLFAGLPERLGTFTIELTLEQDTMSVKQLKTILGQQFADHADLIQLCFVACNQAYATDDSQLHAADELALLPPVSGGETPSRYQLTDQTIAVEEITRLVITPNNGATLSFVGTTREWTQGQRTVRLEYDCYAPMALRTMEQIGEEIEARWPGTLCAIAHRTGVVEIAEISVVIAVSAPHRDACYEASRYAIERLKQIVPIWKKEIWEDGSEWKGHQLGPWNPTASL
ncbi:molybdopterin biosynthesis MoaE protein [Paenibacillus curdlanolyticus YK9]|uniref:Molybdopterin synthase catalytic subunit n=1 Tax=Paenibacillus curdlanolyticus YK9 TaxID=717606 RepID=E0IBW0_9BACL|nr:molybdenum cofactor biosynthesis protein MoaE [Paenibacillus curdlanolyticus]EFM10190.1 molybdopterin biosynthesis MoaE protein [Paenibacillus curdlanolyticus YK9]